MIIIVIIGIIVIIIAIIVKITIIYQVNYKIEDCSPNISLKNARARVRVLASRP